MSPLQAYHAFLLSNLESVQTIESSLSNITWLLPGRFQDAELASEGLYSAVSLIERYHDTILTKHLSSSLSLPPHPFAQPRSPTSPISGSPRAPADPTRIHPSLPPASDHARYTRYWTDQSGLYRRASRALTTVGYLELLVEMVARKKSGERRRWKVVLGLEALKTFLRLILLFKTRRPVLSPSTPQREVDYASLPPEVLNPTASSDSETSKQSSQPLTPSLPAFSPLRAHLLPMVGNLPEEYLEHPMDLIPTLKGSEYVAEIIAASVGLIRVLLLLRASRKSPSSFHPYSLPTLSRSLPPYLIPLLLLFIYRHLRSGSSSSVLGSPLLLSHNATQDRRLAMQAFLTGPLWLGWTRPKIVKVAQGLERIPLVGLVGELVEGYLPLVDDYFYYTCS
ncbi:hypothetical protein L202_04450 [Cryptococcus amylolentus CBS 6039]|uniref:Peroxisomal membrane protein PEX16 n=2 Tax=Cryptococcus amylolentus TaxID=104669 RepID=A0A1E3HRG9_9TREE|nr:hypothetical protein L202_04450 [Cryptococcus amylolentus CBS 6039]ODN78927.1 hypothetical protein L202_04450 [Cryptococcus amylolentus CBS 6039]ODO06613.1 hypothetical protein I350_03970 [Cryptococcus amylolentus CBS 6273]